MAKFFLIGTAPPPPLVLPLTEPMLLFIASLIVAGFGYFLKREVSLIEKRLDRIENSLDLTKVEIGDLPKTYVTRDDFLRAMSAIDDRLDSLEGKIEQKLDLVLDRLPKP